MILGGCVFGLSPRNQGIVDPPFSRRTAPPGSPSRPGGLAGASPLRLVRTAAARARGRPAPSCGGRGTAPPTLALWRVARLRQRRLAQQIDDLAVQAAMLPPRHRDEGGVPIGREPGI